MAKKTLTRAERNILWCERNIYIPEGKFVGQPLKMAEFMKDDFRAFSTTSMVHVAQSSVAGEKTPKRWKPPC
ncbi:hypothetical protein L0F16_24435 [Klebsiella pneumoniae]|nr:hypothetical protein [Klebsiella pneumoniae]